MTSDCRTLLLARKARADRAYARCDAAGKDVEAVGRAWSLFADRTIQRALTAAWQTPTMLRALAKAGVEGSMTAERAGLFLLGLGKLGGHDLNFSSDVDLIAFFDADRCEIPSYAGRTELCARALREMTRLLDRGTAGGFVWRVDWRLRPDPSVTDLAMSTEAGLTYFTFNAAPWRRLALMKSRVVAGCTQSGQRFMSHLHPWIWRRQIDYRAMDDVGGMKAKIKRDHPDLGPERQGTVPVDKLEGFHLKLGAGGIREIEFMVNALQLLWGGRHRGLQTTHTMDALRVLSALGLVAPEDATDLAAAYRLFRRTENRLQLRDNAQIHELPHDPAACAAFLAEAGADPADFLEARARVSRLFEAQFAGPQEAQTAEASASDIGPFDAAARATIDDWRSGFLSHRVPQDYQRGMGAVAKALEAVAINQPLPSEAAMAIDAFIRRQGPGGRTLRAFAQAPGALTGIITPYLTVPLMAILLEQTPDVIDAVISANGTPPLENARVALAERLDAARDYEVQLNVLRAFVNERLYAIYLARLTGRVALDRLIALLTELAEITVQAAADVVARENGLERLPLAILALGKLGMARMGPGSDLDIVFIGEDDADLELVNRLARRLTTALNAKLQDGRAYEIDTRLRPSGKSGAPTVSLRSYQQHQLERAWTWEHLALVPARVVYGTPEHRAAVDAVRLNTLSQRRDAQQFDLDAAAMLARLRNNRADAASVKLRPGGLMEAEYLTAVRAIRLAQDDPAILSGAYGSWAGNLIEPLTMLSNAQFDQRLNQPLPDLTQATNVVSAALDNALPRPQEDHVEAPVRWAEAL